MKTTERFMLHLMYLTENPQGIAKGDKKNTLQYGLMLSYRLANSYRLVVKGHERKTFDKN